MSGGVVIDVDPDWRGDTLTADAASGDMVLSIKDASDFAEDFTTRRYLVVGDETTRREYVACDKEANTVTLAATVGGSGLEAGLPVVLWDPTVNAGARAVEYVATVRLHDGSGEVPATVPHGLIPMSNYEALIGASVSIDEDEDGDWYVSVVNGREPQVDLTFGYMPAFSAFMGSNLPAVPNGTWTTITAWSAVQMDRTSLGFDGHLTVLTDGEYDLRVGVSWAGSPLNSRAIRFHFWDVFGGSVGVSRQVKVPSDGVVAMETAQYRRLFAGAAVSVEVWQNSGADLDLTGSNPFVTDPTTEFQVRWVGPL